jgi:hypothetical protein
MSYDMVTCLLYMLDPRLGLFIAFSQRISTPRFHIPETLAFTSVIVAT